jgi:uncharacterized damage-inducible protein DinB
MDNPHPTGETAMTLDLTKTATATLTRVLDTHHAAVKEQAASLTEAQFWAKPVDPGNSVGHLVLHLTGNLSHFIGAKLGGTGYVREREREFTEANVPPKVEALAKLDEAVATFRRVVEGLNAERLAAPFPEGLYPSVLDGLTFLVAHFALHRGQISYIARLAKK